jgi:GPH family glycoside/pentoside/hexuronide:cation symporter
MQEINTSPSPVKSSGDKPLSLRTKLVFGFGDWGNSSTSTIFGFFFAFFLNNIAGVQPIYAIPVLLAGGIWDAINDPLIGVFADRVRTRWGRRRPFFLFGAIPFGLSFILLWWVPPFESQAALSVYYSLVYILFDTTYTFVAVPYSALTPELTGDYNERTSLNGYRMVVSVVAGLVAAVAMPFFVEQVADKQAAYLAVATVFGILAIIPYLLLFFFIKERFQNVESAKFSIFKGFQLTWRNKPFRYAAGIYTTAWVSVSLAGALFQYYLTFWLRIPTQVDVILGLLMVSTLIFIPLIVFLSKRLGKQKAYIIALGWWAVVMISLFLLPPYFTPVIYFLIAGAGIGVAAAHVIPASMIPDVIDQDELDTGFHREATYYGWLSCSWRFPLADTGFQFPHRTPWLPFNPNQRSGRSGFSSVRFALRFWVDRSCWPGNTRSPGKATHSFERRSKSRGRTENNPLSRSTFIATIPKPARWLRL